MKAATGTNRSSECDVESERLLVLAAQQDPARFAELYERNFNRVYAYALRRVSDRDSAQDLTSEVFLQALAGLDRFEWRGVPFSAWLFRIASNAIADWAKRNVREHNITVADESEPQDFEQIEQRAQLFNLVEELPDDQRKVILMRFANDRSIRDIAAELGRTEGAVKQLQFRGLQKLRTLAGRFPGGW